MQRFVAWCVIFCGVQMMTDFSFAQDASLMLRLRSRLPKFEADSKTESSVREEVERAWKAKETAVIVCDVWDAHHCLNAVRRLEEFAPRMNDVLKEARK